MRLDQTDLKIIYHLQKDGRMSFTELASKLGPKPSAKIGLKLEEISDSETKSTNWTSAAIKYRVERLIQNNLIEKFTIKINKSILTPSYQSYHVSMNINPSDIDINYKLFRASKLFETIFQIAASHNLVGITIPISSGGMKELIEVISNKSILNYTITPIIESHEGLDTQEIHGEEVTKLYCPECQEIREGPAFVEQIGNKEFSFCCKDCRNSFADKYLKILS